MQVTVRGVGIISRYFGGTSIQKFYSQHSLVTNLGEKSSLVDGLPLEARELVRVVQGLLLHTGWAKYYNCKLEPERSDEMYLRTLPEMLGGIEKLDSRPLSHARQPEKRLASLCRDFSVMLVALLRQRGHPARLRVGFAGYFGDQNPELWDHRLAQYWNSDAQRWVMVDAQIDDTQMATLSHVINPFDIGSDAPFLLAGEVWQQCRSGAFDPQRFGDAPDDKGMAPIRYALLHDFDALNKVEVVGFDAWHPLIDKPDSKLTSEDYVFLDEVADLTLRVDRNFHALRDFYVASNYGQTMLDKLSSLAV